MDLLKRPDPILFFDELVLYEDELADNGITMLSCKIRVMPARLLLLCRLRRNYAEICENIRDFIVAESPEGNFLGCGALHIYGPHLAEVRSIVVKPEAKGQGAGGKLLQALLEESEYQGIASVCLFTRIPDFFFHFGFRVADRTTLPDKIYKDCQTCPRLYACDEVAMVRGPLPRIAVLGPVQFPEPELVKLHTGVIPLK